MLLIHAENIKKYYGDRLVIELDDLKIYNGDRIGIVGLNGVGKTTLMELMAGIVEPDSGKIDIFTEYSYIRQFGDVYGAVDQKYLKEFGLKGISRDNMSGGEITRLKISKELSTESGLLFADEPTSNLDLKGIELLQKKLIGYQGAVVLISHDRELLDKVCKRIIELEDGKVRTYTGNYSDYKRQKEMERERQLFEYNQYIDEKKRLEVTLLERESNAASIRKAPKRMGNSEARLHKRSATEVQVKLRKTVKAIETRLEKLEIKEKPRAETNIKMEFVVNSKPVSRSAVRGNNISVKFGKRVLLDNASFEIATGSKTALIGDNGTGKTTLLKMIVSTKNDIFVSNGVKIGYFSQDLNILDKDRTILENVMASSIQREHIVRIILARLLFRREEVFKKVSVLSGGEKVKVALAKIITSDSNLLILDEPTNYLDLASTEALQTLLNEYEGTVLMVSHDRRFIDGFVDNILIIENADLKAYQGNYQQYMQWVEECKKQKKSDNGIEELSLKMKLAQITSKLSVSSKNDDLDELNRQFNEVTLKLKKLSK